MFPGAFCMGIEAGRRRRKEREQLRIKSEEIGLLFLSCIFHPSKGMRKPLLYWLLQEIFFVANTYACSFVLQMKSKTDHGGNEKC